MCSVCKLFLFETRCLLRDAAVEAMCYFNIYRSRTIKTGSFVVFVVSFCVEFFYFLIFEGSFHLLHLMFDEYVLYMVETLHCQERGNELLRAVRGEQTLGMCSSTNASCYVFVK